MRAGFALALAALVGGCGSGGTFVLVDISGSGLPAIASIRLTASFSSRTQMTTLRDPGGGVSLPTTAAIEIKSGSGSITVTADAFDGNAALLASATASMAVQSGHTITMPLALTGTNSADLALAPDLTGAAPPDLAPAPPDFAAPPDLAGAPPAPTGLTTCAANGQVRIGYQAPTGATGINIYYGVTPGVTKLSGTRVSATLASPFAVTGLTNGMTYYFVVTALNANAESNDSTPVSAVPNAAVHDTIFVGSGTGIVDIWDCASAAANGSAPTRTLSNIPHSEYGGLAVDGTRGILYVNNSSAVYAYDNVTTLNGAATASRSIPGTFTGRGIAVDSIHRRLYANILIGASNNTINIYNNSDTVNGATNTVATITELSGTNALWYDAPNDRLYVANNTDFFVVNSASTLNGASMAASTGTHWTINGVTSPLYIGVTVDGTTLYVADFVPGIIYQLTNIAGRTAGATNPTASFTLGTGRNGMPLTVAGNTLYISPYGNSMQNVYVYNNVNTLVGTPTPSRTLAASHPQLYHALYIP
jgi:hypothetical protein